MKLDFKIIPSELSPKHKFYYLLWEITCAFLLVLWYVHFVVLIMQSFLITHDFSALLYLVYELIIILFLVVRRLPKEFSLSPYDWFIAIAGTLGSTLLFARYGISGNFPDIGNSYQYGRVIKPFQKLWYGRSEQGR